MNSLNILFKDLKNPDLVEGYVDHLEKEFFLNRISVSLGYNPKVLVMEKELNFNEYFFVNRGAWESDSLVYSDLILKKNLLTTLSHKYRSTNSWFLVNSSLKNFIELDGLRGHPVVHKRRKVRNLNFLSGNNLYFVPGSQLNFVKIRRLGFKIIWFLTSILKRFNSFLMHSSHALNDFELRILSFLFREFLLLYIKSIKYFSYKNIKLVLSLVLVNVSSYREPLLLGSNKVIRENSKLKVFLYYYYLSSQSLRFSLFNSLILWNLLFYTEKLVTKKFVESNKKGFIYYRSSRRDLSAVKSFYLPVLVKKKF